MDSQRGEYSMATLKKNHLIQKRNVLNEIRSNNMTLQELRFFSIYLSKINKDKPDETRTVRFPMTDFQAIMELSSRIKIDYMKSVTANLLRQIVSVRDEQTGGYSQFQLFKGCEVNQDDSGEWYVEIDAHDKALPLMFEFKNKYFSYQLWNALRLRSSNQLRMYEILKQYETAGERILSVDDLRSLIGIEKNEYPRFGDFKTYVLSVCQKALAEYTDIKFTYEPHGKKGKGGKVLSLKFTIEKNKDYTDQLTLDMYIEYNSQDTYDVVDALDAADEEKTSYQERIEFFMEACNDEFTFDEVVILQDKMRKCISNTQFLDQIYCYHYINDRYKYLELQNKQHKISKRFGYMKSLMDKEI